MPEVNEQETTTTETKSSAPAKYSVDALIQKLEREVQWNALLLLLTFVFLFVTLFV